MKMPTGSGVERADACPGSCVLPNVQETSIDAHRGRVIHAYLQLVSEYDRDKALAVVAESHPDWLDVCAAIEIDELPTELAAEVSFAFDVKTRNAREIGRNLDRNYGDLSPTEIALTVDVVGVSADSVYVGDYKTGFGEVTPAPDNWQLRTGAVAATSAYKRENAIVEIIRPSEVGPPFRSRAEFSIFDLDEFAVELSRLPDRIDGELRNMETAGAPNVVAGKHCKYCPAFNSCPGKVALVRQLVDGDVLRLPPGELTDEQWSRAYHVLVGVEEAVKHVRRAMIARARKSPIDLGNGRMFGEVITEGNERIDGDIAYAVLRNMFDPSVADRAVSRHATKKGIDSALRGVVPKLAPVRKEVLDRIRQNGGASKKPSARMTEFPKAGQ